ncbi:MAG: hypothetical protein HFE97_02510 [Oscillospiraceae bacterium]|nr:hypothetical protein [Oscillospiraceae bacterium]
MSWFDTPCTLGGVSLNGRFIVESGPFGHSGASIAACMKAGFSAVSTETISMTDGTSPWWNIYRAGDSLYNCSKWSDIPLAQWIEQEIPFAKANHAVVIATVGHTRQDMEEIAPQLERCGVDAIKACTYHADEIVEMVCAAKRLTRLPVWAKISANWPDFLPLARECQKAGADALVAIDTLGPVSYWTCEERPALGSSGGVGWLSGAGIHGKALYVIQQLRAQLQLPIVGVGGIMDADGVLRAKAAGAELFGLCSTLLIHGLGHLETIQQDLRKEQQPPKFPDAPWRGKVHIDVDREQCSNCGRCAALCGYLALSMGEQELQTEDAACRRCGLCQQLCPAIHLEPVI